MGETRDTAFGVVDNNSTGAVQVDGASSVVLSGSTVGDLVFLPYPSFVLKPNLYRLARRLFCGRLLHESEKVFLKAAAASSSCA